MLSAPELQAMRDEAALALPEVVTVSRKAAVDDGMGGRTTTFAPSGSYPGRLAPVTSSAGQEGVTADRLTSNPQWWLTLPYGVDVRLADRVTVLGRSFEVVGGSAGGRSYEVTRRVLVQERG